MAKRTVVVLTGATAGVGRATARRLAKPGVCLGLLARGAAGLEATRAEVEAKGGEALALATDVADAAQVEAAAQAVEERFGPPDVWINNAMTSVFSPVRELQPEEVRRVTEVTYLGQVYGTMAALRRMLPRDAGVIVQVGSALAYRGIPLQAAYCGAKHAIQGFTESLRCELIHDRSRVRITMVQMPGMNTPQFGWVKSRLPHRAQPVPPIYQPEVAAEAIAFAIRHPRRQMLVGGSTVKAVEGDKLAAFWLDYYLGRTGFKAQQTAEAEDPQRADNLWRPVDEDRGAHGSFDERARGTSRELWLAMHRPAGWGWAVVAGSLAAGGAAAWKMRTRVGGEPRRWRANDEPRMHQRRA
ncbi:MAG TPA: SDR family oxidoreductase [Terriglobales bacterium]